MIFLSYRVADAAHLVGRLRDSLIATYGTDAVVFRDKTGLLGGDDWGKKLVAEVRDRPIFLPVVGPGWADAKFSDGDKQGELRLDDPNDWVRKEIRTALDAADKIIVPLRMDDTKLRSKDWLTRRGLGELAEIQGLPVCDDPRYQDDFRRLTELLEQKHPPLKALRDTRRQTPHSPPRSALRGKPSVCVGRDAILRRLESLFLPADPTAPLPRLAVAGFGGVGKSTAVLWFLHDERVKERYGGNRHFVPLDGADSRAGVVSKLAEYLGVEVGPNLEARVLATLERGERRLLVLDNAETPLQSGERISVEELFGTLAHFAHVGLVATLRPETHLPNWDTPDCLDRLFAPDDLEAFHKHCGNKFRTDTDATGFVKALDGWPLVLRLAAEQAKNYRTVREFQTVWAKKKAELLKQGADKDSNFAVSVGLSLDSPKMTPAGKRLLAALAHLPDGLLHDDVTAVLGEDGIEAAATVRAVGGLMVEEKEAMRMLAPLREHLLPLLPWDAADRDRAVSFFCDVAMEGEKLGTVEAEAAIALLGPRAATCAQMIDPGLERPDRNPAFDAACGLGKYGRFVGLDFTEPLRRAVQIAHNRSETGAEAKCIKRLGDIALDRSDHADARARYEHALPLYRQAGDVLGEAHCIRRLGDIALRRSDPADARARFEQALALFRQTGSVIGEANCIESLGDIALARSEHADARARYEQALPLYQQVGSVLDEANCIRSLGDIALRRSEHADARAKYEQALPLYQQVGSVLGEANCILSLGDIALRRPDHADARAKYEQALPLYQQVGAVGGEAYCIQSLGDIALDFSDHADARARYEYTLPLFRQIGDVLGEANSIKCLGDIARAEGDSASARIKWEASLELYERIPEPYSIGGAYRRLAHGATNATERERFVTAARAAWASIDLPDLVAKLDEEFSPASDTADAT